MPVLSLTEAQTFTALRGFLTTVCPVIEVVRAQVNRVPEPAGTDFIVMTPLFRRRIETNVDTYTDAAFTGSITGTVLTVTKVLAGKLLAGAIIFGTGVTSGSSVVNQINGTPGGIGTYTVTPSQTVGSGIIAAGIAANLQPTKVTVQIDVHGPASADNAQLISTLFRDEYAVNQFAASGFDVTPLYTSDPQQTPFDNGESQVEYRWTMDAVMQCNPVVTTQQDFAGALAIGVIEVDATYHP
jgi:acetylornithine deacetylase/succinyl-diaminopimelate desuccinylase-like protein